MAAQLFEDWLEQTRIKLAEEWERMGDDAFHKKLDVDLREGAKKYGFKIGDINEKGECVLSQ